MFSGLALRAWNAARRLGRALRRGAFGAGSALRPGEGGRGAGLALAGLLFGLKLLFLSLLVLEAFYLLVGNALLASKAIARLVTTDSGSFELRYASAYTLFPGHVRARGVSVRGRDSTLDWYAAADAATFRIELLELAERRFHAPSARIDGGVFRMRFLLDPEDVGAPRTRALPAIPGAEDPPVKIAGPPEPDDGKSFSAHLEHVEASMREIHIDVFRLHGPSRVRGGFLLDPGERVEVHPSRLFVDGADLSVGGATVLRDASSTVHYRMRAFKPKGAAAKDVLGSITALALSQAEVPSLDALRPYLPEAYGVKDGSGWLRVGVGVDAGDIAPGSSFAYETERLFFELGSFAVAISGRAEGRAEGAGKGSAARLVAEARLSAASLFAPVAQTGGAPPVELSGARLSVADEGVSLIELGEAPSLELDLAEGKVPDLRWLNAVVGGGGGGAKFRFEGGSARAEGSVSLSEKGRQGSVKLEGSGVSLAWLGIGLRFDLDASASVLPDVPGEGWLSPKAAFRSIASVRPMSIRELDDDDRWEGWWTRVETPRFEVGKGRVEAEFDLVAKDTRPVVEILEARGVIPGPAGLLLVLDDWKGRARLKYASGLLELTVPETQAGLVGGEGFLFQKDDAYGAWRFEGGPVSLGVAHWPGGSELEYSPSAAWLAGKRASFAAKVR